MDKFEDTEEDGVSMPPKNKKQKILVEFEKETCPQCSNPLIKVVVSFHYFCRNCGYKVGLRDFELEVKHYEK